MTFDINEIPQDKLTIVDIIHYLIVTPSMWVPCILLIIFLAIFISEIILGGLMINEKHVQYCADVIEAGRNFNTSFVGVGC